MKNASFEEKSVWIQLIALTVVMMGYFTIAVNMWSDGYTDISSYTAPFLWAIFITILLNIIGHIIVASRSKPEKKDERDRLIECRAKTISTHILEVGALAALIMLGIGMNPLWPGHILLLALFVEEIVRNSLSLVFYRRGF